MDLPSAGFPKNPSPPQPPVRAPASVSPRQCLSLGVFKEQDDAVWSGQPGTQGHIDKCFLLPLNFFWPIGLLLREGVLERSLRNLSSLKTH